jgi:hypothetical protein
VNGKRWPSVLSKVLGNVVGDPLGGGEDDDLGVLVRDGVEMLDEFASLLEVGANLDELLDVVIGGELHGSNVDLDGVGQEVGGESLDLLGPGGREEEGLSVRSDLGNDLPDLGLETHVEHSVLRRQKEGRKRVSTPCSNRHMRSGNEKLTASSMTR